MKTITEIKNRVSFPGLYKNPRKFFRIFLYLIVFTGACMTFSSCAGGYIAAEPSYDDVYDRPVSPGVGYIWIDGDWLWNRQNHIYVHEHGHWSRSRHGRSYETGHWESGPRGKYWIKGRWNKGNRAPSREHGHNRR